VISVALAVFSGRGSTPQAAQAAPPPPPVNVVPVETTQACQAVLTRIITLQQTLINGKQSGTITPLAAFDKLVAQEYQLDTSKCPTDFRMAVMRFVTAEEFARIHAHLDKTGRAEKFLGVLEGAIVTQGFSTRSSLQSSSDEKIADEQKRDLANIQSALLNLAQVSMNYGVK
jgi:hypothetical protein